MSKQAVGACNKHFLYALTYTDPVVTNASELSSTDEEALCLRQMIFIFKGETWSAAIQFACSWKTIKNPSKSLTPIIKQINRLSKLIIRLILWLHSYRGLLKSMSRKFLVLERQRKQLKFYCQFSIPQDSKQRHYYNSTTAKAILASQRRKTSSPHIKTIIC